MYWFTGHPVYTSVLPAELQSPWAADLISLFLDCSSFVLSVGSVTSVILKCFQQGMALSYAHRFMRQGGHRALWSPHGAPLGRSTHVASCCFLLMKCLDDVLLLHGSNARMLVRRIVDQEEPQNWPQHSHASYTCAHSIRHLLLPTYFLLISITR